ncbi:MAG: SDR family oxidoreductase [Gemmatimonadaceae bacterium]|nr:SDR family oxidoreductase [Gloeobacterales cyanobacterium ES-bin-141]
MQRVVLITGASGGIGSAVARRLAKEGASLVLAARRPDVLEALAEECRGLGAEAVAVPTDVSDKAGVDALYAEVAARFERLDVVINAAGLGILKSIQSLSEDDLDRQLAVNLKGTFLSCQAAIPVMSRQESGGHIFNIPGILGQHPMALGAAYCASKYAVVGMTKAMALDLKRTSIKFTLLYLGGVSTPFWDNAGLRVQRDKMLTPEIAADAIAFALSVPAPGVPNEIVIQPDSHQFV